MQTMYIMYLRDGMRAFSGCILADHDEENTLGRVSFQPGIPQ